MAKKAGKDNAWLAWVPIGNWFIMGEIVSEKLKGNGGLKYTLLNLFYLFAAQMLSTVVALIVLIPVLIIDVLVMYWIYKKFANAPVLHTILSCVIPMYMVICLFVVSKNEPKNI